MSSSAPLSSPKADSALESLLKLSNALFTDLNVMPYFRNYAAASGAPNNNSTHEKAVEGVLVKHGFVSWEPKGDDVPDAKNVYKSWIDNPSLAIAMPYMTYIPQPCGTQDSPDFVVKFAKNIVLGIECKSSSKAKAPQYNSGGIKRNYIYIFCSKTVNKTTIYVGGDLMTRDQQKLIDELIIKQRELAAEYNKKIDELDTLKRGIYYYTRPMICQRGEDSIKNYFTHKEKDQCEKNVHLFVEEMIRSSFSNPLPATNTLDD